MSELISGKEALIALANGEEVQLQVLGDMNWHDSTQWTVGELLCFKGKFRLKPRTTTINGIEVPVCGSNYQEGETIFVLDDCCDERGYIEYSVSGHQYQNSIPKLWWRNEYEIKQVVAVLRSVFKTD